MSDSEITTEDWMKAKNLYDLGELTAQWLEGKIRWHFSQPAKPDLETSEIADYLIQINRLGFVTDFSQPAAELRNGFGQRACVSGFSNKDTAKKLATLNLHTDLIVFIFKPERPSSMKVYGYQIPVTIENYHPFTWCGSVTGDEIESYEEMLGDEALTSIAESWYITAIDTKWGRKAYLWENLIETLSERKDPSNKYSVEPYPGHNLDVDYVY